MLPRAPLLIVKPAISVCFAIGTYLLNGFYKDERSPGAKTRDRFCLFRRFLLVQVPPRFAFNPPTLRLISQ
ncbi:MAG TPA: hypothetical protein IGS53_09005 [Leptolyngbyaceae cyanobacterium M33_DOE_097]|uniref:Uncharacterized protein n=1 Tax=Oscillatoriales cyanobacterium SpSt-418 TaxID=2282169 RepID=A0A7C3PFJ5_9CYAN|nr:hypothetical protein [Leptolyngbyaceae cyanobacterium M33_DOE_097]